MAKFKAPFPGFDLDWDDEDSEEKLEEGEQPEPDEEEESTNAEGIADPEEDNLDDEDEVGEDDIEDDEDEEEDEEESPDSPLAELDDDTLVPDPITGESIRWGEAKNRMLMHSDYTKKTQELAPFRKMAELYQISPKFRKGVDRLGAETLGYPLEGDDEEEELFDKEELEEKFETDPVGALEDSFQRFEKHLNKKISGRAEAREERGVSPEEVQRQANRETLKHLQEYIGDDWGKVQEGVKSWVSSHSKDEVAAVDANPSEAIKLVRSIYKQILRDREQRMEKSRKKESRRKANRASPAKSREAPKGDRKKKKSVWDMGKKDFQKWVKQVEGR